MSNVPLRSQASKSRQDTAFADDEDDHRVAKVGLRSIRLGLNVRDPELTPGVLPLSDYRHCRMDPDDHICWIPQLFPSTVIDQVSYGVSVLRLRIILRRERDQLTDYEDWSRHWRRGLCEGKQEGRRRRRR